MSRHSALGLLTCLVASTMAAAGLLAAKLPPPTVPGIPGWLGFATIASGDLASESDFSFTPHHAKAQVVIFSTDWAGVRKRTKMKVVCAAGILRARFIEASDEPYGCDSNRQTMAAFRTRQKPSEGPVWILPPEAATDARPVCVADGKRNERSRIWTIGRLIWNTRKTGRMTGEWILSYGERSILATTFEKQLMEGAEDTPIDLAEPLGVHVPQPVAAFEFGQDGPLLIVVATQSYEGIHFQVVEVRADGPLLHDAGYIYQCAF